MVTIPKRVLEALKNRKRSANYRILLFFALFLLWEFLFWLDGRGFVGIPAAFFSGSRIIFSAIIILLVTSILIRLTQSRFFDFFKEELEIEQRIFFTKLYTMVLYTVAIIVILYLAGLTINNATLILGLMTTALAFALRDVFLSFIAWLIILNKNPFRIGDYLDVDGQRGKVLRIGMFYVTLDGADNSEETIVRVPNKIFLEKSFFNHGKSAMTETLRYKIAPKEFERLRKKAEQLMPKMSCSLDAEGDAFYIILRYRVTSEKRSSERTRLLRALTKR